MRNGYNGRILHVDLTEGRWWAEELDDRIYRTHLGGGALSLYFLLRDLTPGVDPLGPDNLLIFMTSVINGLPLSGANRYSAAGKSPLTDGFGESEAGGYWGPELKQAGFDGIIVHGRAERPVYLFVHDGECEIRDASRYWGQLSGEVQDGLEDELGDRRIRVLQTGMAGERGVRFAAMTNQLRHFHGRTGLGAVMGSKNLKAIVVRGGERLTMADGEAAGRVLQWFREAYDPEADRFHLHGTAGGIPILNRDGILPTRNFRDGSFELADAISGETMSETILVNRGTCFACAVACKREVEVPERGVTPRYGGMEYETIAANGSLCGVGDLEAIAEASQWLNRYVLDSISTGAVIAFAMECYEHGILTRDEADGIELTWGNADAVIQMIHKIARREGIGDLLAEGVKRAAARLGRGAERFALHVKGQELPMHEPRGKPGLAIAYAVSPTGADHMEAPHDPAFESFGNFPHAFSQLGLLEPLDRMGLGPEKVRAFFYTQMVWSLYNSIGMCDFVGVPIGALTLERLRDYVNAVTGWDMSLFELMKVGERANTMARLFNLREGFTAADDTLPQRLFEPLQRGRLAGQALDREAFARALRLYYQMAGWDEEGVPTPAKLAELGLTWAAEGAE
ncbi:MAG TPA: aldehyde ferredoxin oxidoreductase [Anaerolineae bacterium]|nr:aldehyde ferredoxin oxidoreductase [Anaerolineae bacterium]